VTRTIARLQHGDIVRVDSADAADVIGDPRRMERPVTTLNLSVRNNTQGPERLPLSATTVGTADTGANSI